MKLGINLLFLEPGRVGGSEIFAREILDLIDSNYASHNKVIVYCRKAFADSISCKNIHVKPLLKSHDGYIKRFVIELILLPIIIFKDKIELLHSMGYTSPLITHCKKIVTIFDTQYKTYPNTVSFTTKLIMELLMPVISKVNDLVITSSKFSQNEIARNLNIDANKIKIIYGAVSYVNSKPVERELRESYLMTSSATHPHKNIPTLIMAMKIIHKDRKYRNLKLYISGFPAKGQKEVEDTIAKLKLEKHVSFLGWVSKKKYKELVSKCLVFVFPSLYEGFGLPPLESMALGTPVVSTAKGSLKEVVVGAAEIVDPTSPSDMAKSIIGLIENHKKYDRAIKKGYERVKEFSWEKSYNDLISIYENL